MARYNVKMSCGHDQEINLIGRPKAKEMKIAYLKRVGTCVKCGPYSKKPFYKPRDFKPYKDN